MWAVAIVMTRQNSTALTRGAAGRDMLSLVPVFDLANHEVTLNLTLKTNP